MTQPDPNRTMVFATGAFSAPVVAQEPREHYLVAVEGSHSGLRIALGTKPLRIGRHAECDVVVPDPEVSSQHCEVSASATGAEALVTDLRSTNGSYVEGARVSGSALLPNGGLLQVGRHVFRHEYVLKSEIEKSQERERDLEKARHYVQSLLPEPVGAGPVRTDWFFLPSAQLGGDAFGYHQLDEHTFVGYLIDVSGHGVGAAMHSVSILNVLRQRALPDTDFHDPAQVLRSLNAMFQMDAHDGMYFTAWYGAYDLRTRTLRYSSAGHHPSYLCDADRASVQPLQTRNLLIGAIPETQFAAAGIKVPAGSTLYVFSDGVFEVATRDQGQWGLQDFLPLLRGPVETGAESARIYKAVREAARPGPLEDDFSMLAVTFL
jgi:serine phosphatase RsbU (regulator of sigma subunit)